MYGLSVPEFRTFSFKVVNSIKSKSLDLIELTKDYKYKVRNCNGKAILHESFADAEKLALETYKKFEMFNKSFEG